MDSNGNTCPICFESLLDKTVGSPDVCDHKFCLTCLEKWTKHGNFCPVDRQKFKKIISGDEVIQIKYKRKKRSLALYDMSVQCEICKDSKESNDTVLLCDSCDLAYHLDCLNPPLKSIPSGNWYCPDCQEVGRKLKSQKTKHGEKILLPKASTNSKKSSSSFRHHLTSPTKKTGINKVSSRIGQNTNLKSAENKYNPVKQNSFSKTDYQKKYSCTEAVNLHNCIKIPPEEFEDFLSISDNEVILTKRKLLNTEEKSFNKNIGKESMIKESSVGFRRLRHVKNATCNSFETLQTGRKTKRLAATIARNKINQNLKKNNTGYSTDSSSGHCSSAENNYLGNASLTTVNHFADIKKSVISHQSCSFSCNNKNTSNYMEEFSLSKPKSMGLEVIEEKSTQMENLNESPAAMSSSMCDNAELPDLVTEDFNRIDLLCTSGKASPKVSPTSTKINNSEAENLNTAQIHDMSESFNNKNITNYTDQVSLAEPKSVNEMGYIEGKNTLIENLNKSPATMSSSICDNAKLPDSFTEDFNRIDLLCTSGKASPKVSPTSTKLNNSEAENLNTAQIYDMSESFNNKNITNYTDQVSLAEPKSVNEMGYIEGKNTLIENLNKSPATVSSSICDNAKLPDSATEDFKRIDLLCTSGKASPKVSPTSTKLNNSEAENLNTAQIHDMSESFNNKNITNYTDQVSLAEPKSVNEIGYIEGKNTLIENLNKSPAAMSSSICDIGKLPDSVTLCASEKADHKSSPLRTKINHSLAVMLNKIKIHTMSKSLSVSEEPDITISTNCKSLLVKEKSPNKRTRKESSRTNSSVDSRVLRRKLRLHRAEMRTKRLAAANARKKLTENFKSTSEESSNNDSSDSLDQHSVAKNDSLEKPPMKTSNHYFFIGIEKALSHQNSPLLFKNGGCSSSEFVISDSERPEGIKEKNTVMEDLNRSAASKSFSVGGNHRTSSIPKVAHCVTQDLNKIESLSVFEKPGCKSSAASSKIKNSLAEELRNVQIHMASESFSVSEKPTIEEPPELTLEPLNIPKTLGNKMLPELLLEPLNVIRNHGNDMLPIIKETRTEQAPSDVEELKHGSFSSAFSAFEKITDTSGSAKKQSSRNMTTNGESHSDMEDCQNTNNLEIDGLSQEKDNSPDMEVDGEENILDSFHIRQVHYAVKARMNLPSELQKIERETWLSHQSKSCRKYKYKSSCKEAEVRISSSSHHQIVSGNEQLSNFFQSTRLDCNKSTHIKKDITEYNKFNPFCESVSSTRPKKLFKVTEYKLQPSDKQVCFNKIPKNVLRSVMGPNSLKHLDIREDGSLFLNWAKSKSR